MGVEIRLAVEEWELDALSSFRYKIYVDEMARPQKFADHERRRIIDPLDEVAYNFAAWCHGHVVGCVRVNFARDGRVEYYRDIMRMDEFSDLWSENVSLCTRMMIDPAWRSTSLSAKLSKACYDLGKSGGILLNYIDCNDHLVDFFTRLGYEYSHQADHEEYGRVNVMRFWMLPDKRVPAASRLFA